MSTSPKAGTNSRMIVVLAVVAFGAATLLATGCNTVKGVGKDIETAGDKTQKAINNE